MSLMKADPLVPCPVCCAKPLRPFFEMLDVPVHCNLVWSEPDSARQCPRGDIRLAFCSKCGFITNLSFQEKLMQYNRTYENSLHFSPRFQKYAQNLAQQLIDTYNLHNKGIIEIGAGKGDFLMLLCQLGGNRGWGFDPSYEPRELPNDVKNQITFTQDFYSERYANYEADLICCRHTLEHIQYPTQLLKAVRRAIGRKLNTAVFFEVPNAVHILQNVAVWDIIYEHCCYFTPSSLAYAFSTSGFQVDEVAAAFGMQYLCVHAFPKNGAPALETSNSFKAPVTTEEAVTDFALKFEHKMQLWQAHLDQIKTNGQRAVLWGAGSKGVTFLNLFKDQNHIQYVVDINPRKHSKYIPGTGQQIVPPEFLSEYDPNVVLIMNPIYRKEIQGILSELQLKAELMCC